jgi:hypothetical protein
LLNVKLVGASRNQKVNGTVRFITVFRAHHFSLS